MIDDNDYETITNYGVDLVETHQNVYMDWERNTCKSSTLKEYLIKCIEDPNNKQRIMYVYNKAMSCWFMQQQINNRLKHLDFTVNNAIKMEVNGTIIDFVMMNYNSMRICLSTCSETIFIFDEITTNDTLDLSQLIVPYITIESNKKSKFIFSKSKDAGNPVSVITSTFDHHNVPIYHSDHVDIKLEIRKLKIEKIMGNIS